MLWLALLASLARATRNLVDSNLKCPSYAPKRSSVQFISVERSKIQGRYAYIAIQYPRFIYDKRIDFSDRETNFRFDESVGLTGGWQERTNMFCLDTLWHRFQVKIERNNKFRNLSMKI